MLPSRLSEALPIPVLRQWADTILEAGFEKALIVELATGGDSLVCFAAQLAQSVWAEIISNIYFSNVQIRQ